MGALWYAAIYAGTGLASVLRRSYEVSPSHGRSLVGCSRALRRWHEWRRLAFAPSKRSVGALVLDSCPARQARNPGDPFGQAIVAPGRCVGVRLSSVLHERLALVPRRRATELRRARVA